MSAEVEGLSGEEIQFLLRMRQMEEMYRQGFVGSMTVHCGKDGQVKFEFRALDGTWMPDIDRRQTERRVYPRDGEERRKA